MLIRSSLDIQYYFMRIMEHSIHMVTIKCEQVVSRLFTTSRVIDCRSRLYNPIYLLSLHTVSLHVLRLYPLDNIRSNTLSNARSQALLSFLNSAAIWSAPSTCGQTRSVAVALLSSKVHVTRPILSSMLDESKLRTNAISVFNCARQK